MCEESTYLLTITVTMMQKMIGAVISTTIPDIVAINQMSCDVTDRMSGNAVVLAEKNN